MLDLIFKSIIINITNKIYVLEILEFRNNMPGKISHKTKQRTTIEIILIHFKSKIHKQKFQIYNSMIKLEFLPNTRPRASFFK